MYHIYFESALLCDSAQDIEVPYRAATSSNVCKVRWFLVIM